MRASQEKVRSFHEKMGYPAADRPTMASRELAFQRYEFQREELYEYLEAVDKHDLVKVADAIADQLYLLLGTAAVFGIDIQPIFDEVHRSNMTKDRLDPVTKKGGKGPGYEPPRIAELLLVQSTGLDEPCRVLAFPQQAGHRE